MNLKTQESYLERIERVLGYINEHLDDDLNMDELADVACFSAYHFHRVYRGLVGETVTQTVRRLRLHRAAGDLIRSSTDIEAIAKRAGYSSVEAFSRAFKSAYKKAPANYRDHVRETPVTLLHTERNTGMFTVEIKEIPARKLAAIAHKGDYMEIGKTFDKAFMWGMKNNMLSATTAGLGLYYDDPSDIPADELRSEAGFVVDTDCQDDEVGLRTLDIKGGRYAVLRHKGPYAELEKAYDHLFGAWLNESGETPASEPVVECYLNDPKTTDPSELLTDICVALQ
ncbi:AraC family transcriptional regulator [Terasakiella sp. A23]|uniref:AraC family transcriptional regulator n=1 Tax=Terasakiella sp. FCG-A23 TaxID=3080561 RepID=UPI002953C5B6|nr:AraC family transcriptional regulator [Terasakiella sp. A23]MDV7339120.1 AraC family transcriptional regulator [Terasakiella sp. A23]